MIQNPKAIKEKIHKLAHIKQQTQQQNKSKIFFKKIPKSKYHISPHNFLEIQTALIIKKKIVTIQQEHSIGYRHKWSSCRKINANDT